MQTLVSFRPLTGNEFKNKVENLFKDLEDLKSVFVPLRGMSLKTDPKYIDKLNGLKKFSSPYGE